MTLNNQIKIFTDGAARGNPGPGGWGAILIFPAGKIKIANDESRMTNNDWVQELGGKEKHTTNNRMELLAVIKSLDFINQQPTINNLRQVTVHTDSSYVLKGAKTWVHSWVKGKWKTKAKQDVLNKDLWQKYLKVSKGLDIEWKLLPGHSGIPANERCDVIATNFADDKRPKLYSGTVENYNIDLSNSVSLKAKSQKLKARSSRSPAYSYVSMVKEIIKTHKTWAECEKRVKGVSNTKFKKSFSLEDENAIIKEWRKT